MSPVARPNWGAQFRPRPIGLWTKLVDGGQALAKTGHPNLDDKLKKKNRATTRPTPKSSAATKMPTRRGNNSSAPPRPAVALPLPHSLLASPASSSPPTLSTSLPRHPYSDFLYTKLTGGLPSLVCGSWIWQAKPPYEAASPDPTVGCCT